VNFDPNMGWDMLERSLADESTVRDFTPDRNTVFSCGVHDVDPVMTFMFRVYDQTSTLADCWIFATDPSGVNDVKSGGAPYYNWVTDPEDIAGCTEM